MAVVYILLPLAVLMTILGIACFIWAVRRGQFDDVETPRYRVLFDDDDPPAGSPPRDG
ncbi:MAG: cbb3-type cytochrome oxidase assembly protein CcoS [Phycisphaerales bacterium]|nr:cbb3-type cytochrome oxidase assembly protein CcoS [Phycisphaerales bacterium]